MSEERPKIALVSAADPKDRRTWSGSTSFMAEALDRHVGPVDCLGPMTVPGEKIKEKLAQLTRKISGRRTYPSRTRSAARFFAEEVSRKLSSSSYDLIVAPAASVEIALLKTDVPVIYISDATFSLMLEVYPIFSSLTEEAVEDEQFFERKAIEKARLLLYPSDWAARSALEDYGAAGERLRVIPFGANIERDPPRDSTLGKRIEGALKILFLAKEWERKGGSIAFDTLKSLLDLGIDAELTVCGVIPPSGFEHQNLKVIPYLDKNLQEERDRFERTLMESHLLLLPTRIECYGIVLCEANAHGLPVFATNAGGIPSIVKEGVNGYLLPASAGGRDFAECISRTVMDADTYSALNRGARDRYEKVLNWDAWGHEVRRAIGEVTGI